MSSGRNNNIIKGWSICERPNLIFRSLVAKPKVPTKTNSNAFFVGNEILSIEQGKIHKKSPFDKNIITHFSTQEHILDYIFSNLSITLLKKKLMIVRLIILLL